MSDVFYKLTYCAYNNFMCHYFFDTRDELYEGVIKFLQLDHVSYVIV
jgi:hypothetical protein